MYKSLSVIPDAHKGHERRPTYPNSSVSTRGLLYAKPVKTTELTKSEANLYWYENTN